MADLAQAVLRQAIIDLFSKSLSGANDNQADLERRYALRLLTDRTGEWAESRDAWCLMADVDPDKLRERIIEVLDGEREIEFSDTEKKNYRLNGLGIARDLWAQHKQDAEQRYRKMRFEVGVREHRRRVELEKERAQQRRDAWAEAGRKIAEANERALFGT